jgi:copper(I)-binding protein
MMLAGYALLENPCPTPIVVVGAESLDFASASVHETVEVDGVSRMREAGPLTIAPQGRLALAPGGLHLMLMGPERALAEGDRARIRLVLGDGGRVFAEFDVRRDAPR